MSQGAPLVQVSTSTNYFFMMCNQFLLSFQQFNWQRLDLRGYQVHYLSQHCRFTEIHSSGNSIYSQKKRCKKCESIRTDSFQVVEVDQRDRIRYCLSVILFHRESLVWMLPSSHRRWLLAKCKIWLTLLLRTRIHLISSLSNFY